ncbi:MAG TPA: FHA domain-containing protein [Tepidisphaeraceae bacterium]|jgi:pSer/pThr/pTyr-binding forkhead associated (FHA) protein
MRQVSLAEIDHKWPILEPIDGCRERPIALSKCVCIAGDRARVNLSLPGETVSRAHALFVTDGHGLYLRDLASLNHVFINDQPVRESSLEAGDVLRIGSYAFRCQGGFPVAQSEGVHAPPAELRVEDDDVHVPLVRKTTLLGSRDDCDVRIPDAKVSPAHAVVFEMDDRRYIRDLRSQTGTFLNGKKIGQSPLMAGDEIRIGDAKLIYATTQIDSDATLAGILTDEEPEAIAEPVSSEDSFVPLAARSGSPVRPAPTPMPSPPPDDLDVIPLMDESGEFQSLAREYAEEKEAPANIPAKPRVAEPALSDSGIIPLLDESGFGSEVVPHTAVPIENVSEIVELPVTEKLSGSAYAADIALPGTTGSRAPGLNEPRKAPRKQKAVGDRPQRRPGNATNANR